MGRGYHMDEHEANAVAGNMENLREARDDLTAEVASLEEIIRVQREALLVQQSGHQQSINKMAKLRNSLDKIKAIACFPSRYYKETFKRIWELASKEE